MLACRVIAQFSLLFKVFFRVELLALRIFNAICALKNNRANCANSFRLIVKVLYYVFVKVNVLKKLFKMLE